MASLATTRPRLENVVVLVVDDVPDLRRLIAKVLRQAGAATLEAGSVHEALSILKVVKPHVIVSDIAMPDSDGYDLIRTVRSRMELETLRTPAIALTSFSQQADRDRSFEAGFQEHVCKPFEHQRLIETVARLAKQNGSAVAQTWPPVTAQRPKAAPQMSL